MTGLSIVNTLKQSELAVAVATSLAAGKIEVSNNLRVRIAHILAYGNLTDDGIRTQHLRMHPDLETPTDADLNYALGDLLKTLVVVWNNENGSLVYSLSREVRELSLEYRQADQQEPLVAESTETKMWVPSMDVVLAKSLTDISLPHRFSTAEETVCYALKGMLEGIPSDRLFKEVMQSYDISEANLDALLITLCAEKIVLSKQDEGETYFMLHPEFINLVIAKGSNHLKLKVDVFATLIQRVFDAETNSETADTPETVIVAALEKGPTKKEVLLEEVYVKCLHASVKAGFNDDMQTLLVDLVDECILETVGDNLRLTQIFKTYLETARKNTQGITGEETRVKAKHAEIMHQCVRDVILNDRRLPNETMESVIVNTLMNGSGTYDSLYQALFMVGHATTEEVVRGLLTKFIIAGVINSADNKEDVVYRLSSEFRDALIEERKKLAFIGRLVVPDVRAKRRSFNDVAKTPAVPEDTTPRPSLDDPSSCAAILSKGLAYEDWITLGDEVAAIHRALQTAPTLADVIGKEGVARIEYLSTVLLGSFMIHDLGM